MPCRTATRSRRSLGPPCLKPPALRPKGRANRALGRSRSPGSDTRHARSPEPDKRHSARRTHRNRHTRAERRVRPCCCYAVTLTSIPRASRSLHLPSSGKKIYVRVCTSVYYRTPPVPYVRSALGRRSCHSSGGVYNGILGVIRNKSHGRS